MRDREDGLAVRLLDWYDAHARTLPWRVGPMEWARGVRPDPYRVWLSEIMLQQTTVAAVGPYFHRFIGTWPRVADLAAAPDAEVMAAWAGLGYYARARNLLKCARVVAGDLGGVFPDTVEGLRSLPGIGPYTAAAVAAIAFDRPETVVDGNVERVMARLHAVRTPLPAAKATLVELAGRSTPTARHGDYAQAVMDLGATVCTPKNPSCGICPLAEVCAARDLGLAATLPARQPKAAKPVRRGYVYVARRPDGAVLLERRPDSGLLGGMLGFPGSAWGDDPDPAPPFEAAWQVWPAGVRHTFTHFHLDLTICVAEVPEGILPATGAFVPRPDFRPAALPTVMRKVHDLVSRPHQPD
jgi:A/G-specific adenine glycosylase